MKINSLYKFYKFYFGYEVTQNKKRALAFVFGIQKTIKILKESYMKQDEDIINNYFSEENKHPIAVKFLKNSQSLFYSRSEYPLEELEFIDSLIKIQQRYLINKTRDGVKIPFQYIWDNKNKDVIVFTFGTTHNFMGEIEVLLGLIYNFNIDKPLNKKARTITYWDLSKGTENSIEINNIVTTSKEDLIKALNNYILHEKKSKM